MAWANQHLPINARVLNWSLRGSFLARDQAPVDPVSYTHLTLPTSDLV